MTNLLYADSIETTILSDFEDLVFSVLYDWDHEGTGDGAQNSPDEPEVKAALEALLGRKVAAIEFSCPGDHPDHAEDVYTWTELA